MKNLIKAVFTLSFFTIIERILGFFFKIYLSRQLGAAAMGVYQVALSFFFVLLTFTTSGVPLIVSKLTAKCRAENEFCVEGAISAAALIISTATSLLTCAVILLFNRAIGSLFAEDESRVLLLLMLPALIFSGIYSAFRGNLWGREKYTAVSLLELSEQVARIAVCVLMFAVGFDKLKAAAVSMSVGCMISSLACTVVYFASKARLNNPKPQLLPLLKASAPVTAARAATSAVSSLTAIVAPFLLRMNGLSAAEAMYEYGYSVGMALPLLYIPLTIVGSLAFVMIPTLSQAYASKNFSSAAKQIENAVGVSLVLATMFFPVFFALGRPVGEFVYGNADAGKFLSDAAWLLIPISLENITSSMMNSLDLESRGLVNYLIGAALMFAICFLSGKGFSANVLAIGMGASWILSSILHVVAMKKRVGVSLKFLLPFLKSALACIPTVFFTKWLYALTGGLPEFVRLALSASLGFVFILLLAFATGALKTEIFFGKRRNRLSSRRKRAILQDN